jgi:hypothetical protein
LENPDLKFAELQVRLAYLDPKRGRISA